MREFRPTRGLYDTAAGRIMGLLRRGSMTVDDLAATLDLSGNALEFKSFRHPEHVFTA